MSIKSGGDQMGLKKIQLLNSHEVGDLMDLNHKVQPRRHPKERFRRTDADAIPPQLKTIQRTKLPEPAMVGGF